MYHTKWSYALLLCLTILLGIALGIRSAQASTNQVSAAQIESSPPPAGDTQPLYQPDADTLTNFEALRALEKQWEQSLRAEGWLRHSYHHQNVDDQAYRSPDVQFPAQAILENWFHFNRDGLVDRQISFITKNGQKHMTAIYANGVYRGLSDGFTPLEEGPSSPSLYFYLTRAAPDAAASEGVQVGIDQETAQWNGSAATRFSVRTVFPNGMPGYTEKDASIRGFMNVVSIDPATAQLLEIESHFLLKDGSSRPDVVISDIEAQRFAALPEDVQWYFDQYDQLDWASFIQAWSSQ
ncbi:MAG TPA: hypothetical protein VFF68_08275 [Anaerolineaceae bacterium]|nr:hypothetical protein [Anaerolineaceae bacterium]